MTFTSFSSNTRQEFAPLSEHLKSPQRLLVFVLLNL